MHVGHAAYPPSHHMEPNFAQAQCSGQMPMGDYCDPYHVTGACDGNENQHQSNVRSNIYDECVVTNRQGSHHPCIRPAMLVK